MSICHTPFAISFASNTTKSDSPAVQLFKKERMYPSSSSASGTISRIDRVVESDGKKELEYKTGRK